MSEKIIIANWKMALTLDETKVLTEKLIEGLANNKNLKKTSIILCPSFISLSMVGQLIKKSFLPIYLGAQNVFWQEKGAYTGEISPLMLKELGVRYIIIGHSERRVNLKETDEMINKKIKIALDYNFIPILCVGETIEERQSGKTEEKVKNQLKKALERIENCPLRSREGEARKLSSFGRSPIGGKIENLIIAYEPVWAIGAGKTVEPAEAEKVAELIREESKNIKNLSVIYGGSIDSNNIKGFLEKNINGFLVGGASLDPEEFVKIIKVIFNSH